MAPHRWLVQGAHDSLLSELHTDLTLVTKEGISIAVHRIMLSQCSNLLPVVFSASCCGGRCNSQAPITILLPDLPYRPLKVALDFLYCGRIECFTEERSEVREVLRLLGFPSGLIEVEEKKNGWVSCTSCSAYLPQDELPDHMIEEHVLKPAEADVDKVGRGDNSTVRCSYTSSQCFLDTNLGRVNNGYFNYVGLRNPLECVVQHYMDVHLEDMVSHLRTEWDIEVEKEQHDLFVRQLTKLKDKVIIPVLEVSLEEGRTGFDEEDGPQSGDIMTMETSEEGEDEEVESLYSGNMDSPIEDVGHTDAENESDMAVEDSSSVDTIPFVDTVVVGNLPDVVGMSSSSVGLEGEDMVGDEEPVAKKPKKDIPVTKCRICYEVFSSVHFKRHVTSHVKGRWTEVQLGEGGRKCDRCGKNFQGRDALIVHLATKHNELAAKLEVEGESISDYEVREVDNVEQEQKLSLMTATKEEVRKRVGLPDDYFSEKHSERPVALDPAEEVLAAVEELISDQSEEESGGTSGPPPADSDNTTDTEPFDAGTEEAIQT